MSKKKKATWGGRRANQTGRPTMGESKRIHFGCVVDASTKVKLADYSRRSGKSLGQIIDDLAKDID